MCLTLSNNIFDCYPFINQSPNNHYFPTQLFCSYFSYRNSYLYWNFDIDLKHET